jgi:two-component system nitrate/nitrite response regulator NarL
MCTRIRVLVVDDHDLIVEGIKSILQSEPDLDCVSQPVHGELEVLDAIRSCQPDVLLQDAKMPDFELLPALDKIAAQFPRLRVIIVTAYQDPELVKAVARRGTAGYILKEEGLSDLLPLAIREVAQGKTWYSPRANQCLFMETAAPSLNDYQQMVLRLMMYGKTPEEIATELRRSVQTIYQTQGKLRKQLGVTTNEQAIVAAIREGLVPLTIAEPQ